MLMDKELEFSTAQAITATALSTNAVDLTKARDIGNGENLYIMIQVDTAFTDADSNSTVAVTLVTSDAENLGSSSVVQNLITLPALAAAGSTYYVRIDPANLVAFKRYIGLNYTLANGNLTTGAVTAAIVLGIQKTQPYASGYAIQ